MTLDEYKKLLARQTRLAVKVSAAREELAKGCRHPASFQSPYPWEHDNGYGRQSKYVGRHCGICFAVDLWLTGDFRRRESLTL